MTTCLIVGDADNVSDDVNRARDLCEYDIWIGVKRIIGRLPFKIDAYVSLHPELAHDTIENRYRAGFNMDFDVYHNKMIPSNDKRRIQDQFKVKSFSIVDKEWAGSSGLFAVQIAKTILGADRIVLAGIPMDTRPRMGSTDPWAGGKWSVGIYQKAWVKHRPDYAEATRSMSGWTMDLLGEPTEAWLTN